MADVRGGLRRSVKVPPARWAGAWLVWWVLLMSFWLTLADSIGLDELLAGAGAAVLGAFLAQLAGFQAAARFRMRIEWVLPALRLPGRLLRDTVVVFAVLWRRLARGEEPRSGFREQPVRFGARTAEGRARRVLLVGGRSVAPNTIALGVDAEHEVIVVHQLVTTREEAAG